MTMCSHAFEIPAQAGDEKRRPSLVTTFAVMFIHSKQALCLRNPAHFKTLLPASRLPIYR
jgi:hypothetical protein